MNAFLGLFKKEFKLTQTFLITMLSLLVLYMVTTVLFAYRVDAQMALIVFAAVPMLVHLIYLAIYMCISLFAENKKLHLWLHNPQPAVNLLSAKLLNGVLAATLSMGISAIYLFFSLAQVREELFLETGLIVRTVALVAVFIILASIYLSIWIVAGWSVFQAFKTYIGKWAIIVTLGFVFLGSLLLDLFENTALFKLLTDWGHISIGELLKLDQHIIAEIFSIDSIPAFPLGIVLYQLVIAVILFSLACWLIDRKVEV